MAGKRKVRPFEPIDKEQRLQEHFKTIRMATGMTTVEFADKIGVSRQLINFIESGKQNLSYMVYLGVEGFVTGINSRFVADLWDILVDHSDNQDDGGYSKDYVQFTAYWGSIIAGAVSAGVISVSEADDAWLELDSLTSDQ